MVGAPKNQNPEQEARDAIDRQLTAAGWIVQNRQAIDFNTGRGIAVREYPTDAGPADYVLFVDRQALGDIEAKPEAWGHRITTVEDQSQGYANARLKWWSGGNGSRACDDGRYRTRTRPTAPSNSTVMWSTRTRSARSSVPTAKGKPRSLRRRTA